MDTALLLYTINWSLLLWRNTIFIHPTSSNYRNTTNTVKRSTWKK